MAPVVLVLAFAVAAVGLAIARVLADSRHANRALRMVPARRTAVVPVPGRRGTFRDRPGRG